MRRGGSALHGSGGAGGQIGNVAGLGGGKGGSANSGSHSIGNVAGLGSGSSHAGRTRSGRVRSRTDSSFTQRGTHTIPRTAGGDPNGGKGGGLVLSRRNLIIGAVGVGALAALGGGAAFISSQSAQNDDVVTLEVPESAVTSSDDLGDASPAEEHMTLAGSFDLEYGTLVWASDDQVAACLVPGETANPLCQAGILSLSSGNLTILLERAQGTAEGFQIYEARATSHGLIWIEADILENSWRVYTASLASNGTLGTPAKVDEGGGDWETPSIAAVGTHAFWEVMPKRETDASSEDSLLKTASFGSSDVQTICTSTGRFATPPYAADGAVIVTPRTDTSGVHYQLTRLDAESGQVTDSLVLPQGMSPLEAGYGDTGFMFSFDAIYNYGGGIANLGTYCPAQDARNGDYSAAPWFRFARTPSAAPAWCGGYLMVKSTNSVCGVDLGSGTWFSLGVDNGADDYGDYLATTGAHDAIVTYSNIDHTPLDGEHVRCCRVKVWRPLR